MSETTIPGICAKHAIITPDCRRGRGDESAAIEAMERVSDELFKLMEEWPEDGARFHIVLTVERLSTKDAG